MEYDLEDYYLVKLSKKPPKDDYDKYAKKVIDRAHFIIPNTIDELDGTNKSF